MDRISHPENWFRVWIESLGTPMLEELASWLDGDPRAIEIMLQAIGERIRKCDPEAFRRFYVGGD